MPANVVRAFRLLIVEDNPHTAGYLEQFLPCFAVEAVRTLAEALARLGKEPSIHAVLLDMHLDDGVGKELIRAVVAAAPTVPVIAITGLTDIDEVAAIEAGAEELVLKPLMLPGRLANTIKMSMARRRARLHTQGADAALARCQTAVDQMQEDLTPPFQRKPKSDPKPSVLPGGSPPARTL